MRTPSLVINEAFPAPKPLPPEEYEEYCRCWWVFLHRIQGRQFRAIMDEHASRVDTTVSIWPMNWPRVQHVFEAPGETWRDDAARQRFVKAVQEAEKAHA